jgi:hypothetical protein
MRFLPSASGRESRQAASSRGLPVAFSRHDGIYRADGVCRPQGAAVPPPAGRPRASGFALPMVGQVVRLTPFVRDMFEKARALGMRLLRDREVSRSDVSLPLVNLGRVTASRSGPGQALGRAGKNTPCPSSAMSSGRLFLDRVARQQSPSPLRRHPQISTHSPEAPAKGDISTLPGRGHFYFALTGQFAGLTIWVRRCILFAI